MKQEGIKLTWLTSYDYPTSVFAEKAGIEMLLVERVCYDSYK